MQPRISFITGTDTGVGKTLLTGLLLQHLRERGCRAVAMKPFCSGGRADVEFLHAVQKGALDPAAINPFYFSEPIAPLMAARLHRRKIPLSAVLAHIRRIAAAFTNSPIHPSNNASLPPSSTLSLHSTTPFLLIEGSGGLLVPLGEGYSVADLIAKLKCDVVVASRNRLGTINHTMMTIRILQDIGVQRLKVVLMNSVPPTRRRPSRITPHATRLQDSSTASNRGLLSEILSPIPVFEIPFLGPNPTDLRSLKKSVKKLQKTLAQICP